MDCRVCVFLNENIEIVFYEIQNVLLYVESSQCSTSLYYFKWKSDIISFKYREIVVEEFVGEFSIIDINWC